MDQTDTFVLFGSGATTMLSMLIFLATGTLAFAVMIGVRAREAVRRRAAEEGHRAGAGYAEGFRRLTFRG